MKLRSFIILLFLFGCKSTEEKQKNTDIAIDIDAIACVKMVLERDSVLGGIRNHSSEKISLSETINNYTNDLKSLNYSKCPEKFNYSFDEHIKAWLDIRKVSDKYPSMRGELHDIFARLEKSEDSIEFKILVQQVWNTWNLIEENAN